MSKRIIFSALCLTLAHFSYASLESPQIVATFTNSMFQGSVSSFEVQTDNSGIVQNVRWFNPSYQTVPPDHKIASLLKETALDIYQNNYKTIVLKGGPIDYQKGEGNFAFGFMSGNNTYLRCPFVLKRVNSQWKMFADREKTKPIKTVYAVISMLSGVQEIQGGLNCKIAP